jgi:MraZ protein
MLELMFMGEFTHAIDDKGRLTIPVKFREELAYGAVITRGYDRHLMLYSADAFKRITARAETLSLTNPEHRALLRLTYSGASEAVPDRQGRILVPEYLRQYAGIDTECVIVGVGHAIEVWSTLGWAEQLQALNDASRNAERFAALNLAPGPS